MKTTIRNVEIKSVAAWLPANKISLLSFCGSFPEKQVRDVIRSSGAEYVYRAEEGQKASDLCFNAAEHLIERDNIDRSSIDGLVFVSSTREWIIPDTAVSLQHRLGLSTETVCQDINYGCTGYIYGLLQASAWINCGMCRNILVLCSEVLTPYLDSHAVGSIETSEVATATLVAQGDSHMTIHLSSNGSTHDGHTYMRITDFFIRRAQLRELGKNPQLITAVENPTEEVQLAAVRQKADCLLQLREPTEKVCLAAIAENPEMIRYIHEPTEKMQLLVVRRNPEMITLLENPCERAQLLAVMADSGLITAIGSPSANTQLSVVRKDPHLIREISVPDWKAQLYAVGQDPELIRFISEPAEKVQLSVLNGDASLIRLVRTPTEKAQMLAVGRNSSLIGHIKNPTEKVQLMAVHDSPANILRIKNPSRQACLSCLGSVMPGGTAGIHFKEDISEAVKNLFTRLGEIEERYGELMRDAGHMDTYDARYEATEKAEAYRTRKISAAVGTFRKEAVLETSAVPEKTVAVEKTEATEAQPSSGEMRFKGGRRELTIRNGSAVLRTNGESFDATDILKDMSAHGVDIDRVSGKAMSEMLKGNKTALPGASGNSVFAIVKGPAGYGLKAFQIAKQVHSAAAQEI